MNETTEGQIMTTRASEIYEELKTLRFQLEQLADAGRVVMTRDKYNTDHTESGPAVAAALAGFDQAIDAACWMETLATVEGSYPELRD